MSDGDVEEFDAVGVDDQLKDVGIQLKRVDEEIEKLQVLLLLQKCLNNIKNLFKKYILFFVRAGAGANVIKHFLSVIYGFLY
jgi:hypothetical protein